jgi:hypothetical protein
MAYESKAGATNNLAKGGQYDDPTTAVNTQAYPNLAAQFAADAAQSAIDAANSASESGVYAANSAASATDSSIYAADASSAYAQADAIATSLAGGTIGFDASAYDFGSVNDASTYFNRDFGVL